MPRWQWAVARDFPRGRCCGGRTHVSSSRPRPRRLGSLPLLSPSHSGRGDSGLPCSPCSRPAHSRDACCPQRSPPGGQALPCPPLCHFHPRSWTWASPPLEGFGVRLETGPGAEWPGVWTQSCPLCVAQGLARDRVKALSPVRVWGGLQKRKCLSCSWGAGWPCSPAPAGILSSDSGGPAQPQAPAGRPPPPSRLRPPPHPGAPTPPPPGRVGRREVPRRLQRPSFSRNVSENDPCSGQAALPAPRRRQWRNSERWLCPHPARTRRPLGPQGGSGLNVEWTPLSWPLLVTL